MHDPDRAENGSAKREYDHTHLLKVICAVDLGSLEKILRDVGNKIAQNEYGKDLPSRSSNNDQRGQGVEKV